MEIKRQLDVLNRRLASRSFIIGDALFIANIAIFPWHGGALLAWGSGLAEFLNSSEYPLVERWAGAIEQRPAMKRAIRVYRIGDSPAGLIRELHSAADLD